MLTAPVWRSFGTDSSPTTGCVEDGAFAGITLNLGPENSMAKNPRCLTRAFDVELFDSSSQFKDVYPLVMQRQSYRQLQFFIDGLDFLSPDDMDKGEWEALVNPHTLGHTAIGGDVSVATSPTLSKSATLLSPYLRIRREGASKLTPRRSSWTYIPPPTTRCSGYITHCSTISGRGGRRPMKHVSPISLAPEPWKDLVPVATKSRTRRWILPFGWAS